MKEGGKIHAKLVKRAVTLAFSKSRLGQAREKYHEFIRVSFEMASIIPPI